MITYKASKTYWVPTRKWQLLNWLDRHCGYSPKRLKKMKLNQLLAIYHKTRQAGR